MDLISLDTDRSEMFSRAHNQTKSVMSLEVTSLSYRDIFSNALRFQWSLVGACN